MKIKVSLDFAGYNRKPNKKDIIEINNRITKNQKELELHELAEQVGNKGRTFCPAVFSGEKRIANDFLEMQLFVLDFDGGVSLEDIEQRAKKYRLNIAFKYTTFSSSEENPKFRVVFLNDVPVTDKWVAEIMIKMLMRIFPEADENCKDVSRMFFGGKGMIGEIQEENIDIVRLMVEFQRYIFEKEPKNYVKEIHRFAKKNGVACINNCLRIRCVHKSGSENDDFLVGAPYIHRAITKFPSFLPVYEIEGGYQADVRKKDTQWTQNRVDLSGIEKRCQLYSDFLREPHISHNERFLLLTNMLHMNGGKKRFLAVCERKGYDVNAWRYYAKYVKDSGYKPQSCDNGCPYANSCKHKTNMLLTVKEKEMIVKTEIEQYYPVETVYSQICISLKNVIESPGRTGFYLIPAQTAIGKTEAYCRLIKEYEKRRFIVAVPTNCLKREIEERLKECGIDSILVTPSLDEMRLPEELAGEVEFLYEIGLAKQVSEVIRRYRKENQESQDPDTMRAVYACERYLCTGAELQKKRVIVTTHARLATLTEDIIKGYDVIVDEDILSTFFKNIRIVGITDVIKALALETTPPSLRMRLEQILWAEDGIYETFDGTASYEYISKEQIQKAGISGDINSISLASTFQKKEGNICYFCPQTLPKGKYIVLSATLDEMMYRTYFRGWYVECAPYYRAEYKGRLEQLTAYSMSRQCISENREKLQDFLAKTGQGFQIITFLRYEKEFASCGIHFGNAEGIDILKGKNLMIIGTPHQNEFVYKLIGHHLGIKVNGETLVVRRIKNGGYEFSMMSYKGEELQGLQIYFIRKELEQCIGRARLLRSDCKVVVLSNFPCEQAELIQEDYLETVNTGDREVCGPDMAGKL